MPGIATDDKHQCGWCWKCSLVRLQMLYKQCKNSQRGVHSQIILPVILSLVGGLCGLSTRNANNLTTLCAKLRRCRGGTSNSDTQKYLSVHTKKKHLTCEQSQRIYWRLFNFRGCCMSVAVEFYDIWNIYRLFRLISFNSWNRLRKTCSNCKNFKKNLFFLLNLVLFWKFQ